MPEDTIVSAAWRTWASVIPQPKLFQLFQPSGGVSAGLPGAAGATGAAGAAGAADVFAVTVAIATSKAAARCGSLVDRMGIFGPFSQGDAAGAGVRRRRSGGQQVELVW